MSDDQAAAAGSDEEVPQGSVFGNLPGSRPGVRSPRRDRGRRSEGADPVESEPESPPIAADEPEPAPEASAPESEHEPDAEGRGIEDAAWAGVAAAAEAATIGVRIANRAFEALRDAVDRR